MVVHSNQIDKTEPTKVHHQDMIQAKLSSEANEIDLSEVPNLTTLTVRYNPLGA